MNKTFHIYWNDIAWHKKQEFIDEIVAFKIQEAKKEADEWGINNNWEKEYCKAYSIDHSMIEDLKYNWQFALQNHFENLAEDVLSKYFNGESVEIEL